MKKVFLLMMPLSSLLLFTACMKSPFNTYEARTIHGRIVDSTTNLPLSNSTFNLVRLYTKGLNSGTFRTAYPFTTDTLGNFKISFGANSYDNISVGFPGDIYHTIPIWEISLQYASSDIDAGIIKTKKP